MSMPSITNSGVSTTTIDRTSTQGTQGTSGVATTGSGISGQTGGVGGVPTGSQTGGVASTNTSGTQPSNTGQAQRRVGEAQTNAADTLRALNDLISSLRDPDQLAALLIEMNNLQRQQALDQRLASRDTAKAQMEGQAAEMRDAAIKEIASAAVAVVMAVVSFAVSMVGAMKMGKETSSAIDAGKQAGEITDKISGLQSRIAKVADKLGDDALKQLDNKMSDMQALATKAGRTMDAAFRKSDLINTYTQAANSLIKGIGEGLEGTLRGLGKMDDAQGQILAANAEDTKADADQIKEFMNSIDELLKAALEFMQKLNDAEVELMASASRL